MFLLPYESQRSNSSHAISGFGSFLCILFARVLCIAPSMEKLPYKFVPECREPVDYAGLHSEGVDTGRVFMDTKALPQKTLAIWRILLF